MRHVIALSMTLLGAACAHHARPESPPPAPRIACELAVSRVIAQGEPVIVRVTLRNAGRSRAWVVREIDTIDATWVLDGRDDEARRADALAMIPPAKQAEGIVFTGRTGEGFGLLDYVEVAPGERRSFVVDLFAVLAHDTEAVGGIDISRGTLLRRALDTPGRHQLGLTVRSYPASEYHREDDPPYDTEWAARCPPVEIETRTP